MVENQLAEKMSAIQAEEDDDGKRLKERFYRHFHEEQAGQASNPSAEKPPKDTKIQISS